MNVTRKTFLSYVAAGAATAALAPQELLAVLKSVGPQQQYKAAVGRTFTCLGSDGRTASLLLKSYEDKSSKVTTQFTLWFETPGGERLPEGRYAVSARGFPSRELFLIPGAVLGGVPTYRADFNLLGSGSVGKT